MAGHLFKNGAGPDAWWCGQWWSFDGRRRKLRLSPSRREAQKLLDRIIAKHDAIKNGILPPPKKSDHEWSFQELFEEHVEYGKASGGRGGRPWSREYRRKKVQRLKWWRDRLDLVLVSDLVGRLADVEAALRELSASGSAGKTTKNYAEALQSFVRYCVTREYLESDPLSELGPIDTTPVTTRRAMTPEEIRRLLAAAPEKRRLTYEVAFCTGLRAGELRALTVGHLDTERAGLRLDAKWTKNRKPGFQPLPTPLVERLAERAGGKEGTEPLLYLGSNTSRDVNADLKRAGIPKEVAGEGKLDFHASRVAYTNLVLDSGASVREAQELLRHSTPQLTMNVYGRARSDRLYEVAEQVGKVVLDSGTAEEDDDDDSGPSVAPETEAGDEDVFVIEDARDGCDGTECVCSGRSIPPASTISSSPKEATAQQLTSSPSASSESSGLTVVLGD